MGNAPVRAHHSHLEFSSEPRTIEGELVNVAWHNPHPGMVLRVAGADGPQEWHVQVLGNINGLSRTGVTGASFTIGERLAITGLTSERRPGLLLGTQVRFADGRVAALGPDESSGQAIYRANDLRPALADPAAPHEAPVIGSASLAAAPGNSANGAAPVTLPSAVTTEPRAPDGIFRVWVVADRFRNPDLPLTAEARAIKNAFDPVTDDPQIGCRPLGMPGAMMSPHPIEFRREGTDILLALEEWDSRRLIHMDPAAARAAPPPSPMGHSVGRWDGATLVVTTTRIDYPWMDEHGTPQTAAVEVVERFTPSDDGRSLDWQATVTDPGTLTAPVIAFTTRWQWVPGETLQPYDCAVLELPPALSPAQLPGESPAPSPTVSK